jgi:DnaJ-class molecular chaperone
MIPKTTTEWFREQEGWRHVPCCMCNATGMQSQYSLDGSDFLGPKECDSCAGTGQLWVTPRGRHVLYPGGPFV